MINHAKSILNFNGNREDTIERLSRASNRVVNLASIRPAHEEPEKAKSKIVPDNCKVDLKERQQ